VCAVSSGAAGQCTWKKTGTTGKGKEKQDVFNCLCETNPCKPLGVGAACGGPCSVRGKRGKCSVEELKAPLTGLVIGTYCGCSEGFDINNPFKK